MKIKDNSLSIEEVDLNYIKQLKLNRRKILDFFKSKCRLSDVTFDQIQELNVCEECERNYREEIKIIREVFELPKLFKV
ncbi:hypothetical protein [Bacillus sp. OAE603]|uniref:hypothetical protein n=1 Tax=Gottfriedia sp. OAE603 TaxID=2663872 RepID=UPI001789FD9B